jgi:hypothetical protein
MDYKNINTGAHRSAYSVVTVLLIQAALSVPISIVQFVFAALNNSTCSSIAFLNLSALNELNALVVLTWFFWCCLLIFGIRRSSKSMHHRGAPMPFSRAPLFGLNALSYMYILVRGLYTVFGMGLYGATIYALIVAFGDGILRIAIAGFEHILFS